jgi:HEAT repeat protein
MTEGKKSLRSVVDEDLRKTLDNIWAIGESSYHQFIKGSTSQGNQHSKAIEKNLGRLISDDKKRALKSIGCFLLSASACLHDLGKVIQDNQSDWCSNHGERSAEIILKHYPEYGLKRAEAIAIAYIVSVHDDGKLEKLPLTPFAIGCDHVNLIELAAIFRLGDMLHISSDRAPENVSKILFPQGNVSSIWLGRQAISGWYLDNENHIILQAEPKPNEELEAIFAAYRWTKEDLNKISANLKIYGFPSELGPLDVKGEVFLEKKPQKYTLKCQPLPGMGYYTRENADIFRGRKDEISSLLSMICYSPISLLVGESGSGKTSLINAGIIPRFEDMGWKCLYVRPFDDPQENIKKVVWQLICQEKIDPKKSFFEVFKRAEQMVKPQKLLIIIDQFEEILNFTVAQDLDEFCLALTAVQANTIVPNLKVLISFREDSRIKINNKILNRIAGSAQQFPTIELQKINREGAKEAMKAILETVGIGFDPNIDKIGKPLIDIILDDLQNTSDLIYPPFLQMVLETLFKKTAKSKLPLITLQIYQEELKRSDNIIANYLANQLEAFGNKKEEAEKVLFALTSSKAGKAKKKSLEELCNETGIELKEMKEISSKMVDSRMLRPLGNDEFELIHDYLGKIIDENITQETRTNKFLQEQLEGFQQAFKVNKTLINQQVFNAILYHNRKKVKITDDKYSLILGSNLQPENGLGWYFLRNLEKPKLVELINEQINHPYSEVRKRAIELLANIDPQGSRDVIIRLFQDQDPAIRLSAIDALAKVALAKDKESILKLVDDQDANIKRSAIEALVKIGDRKGIIQLLHNQDAYVHRRAVYALMKLALRQDREIIINLLRNQDHYIRMSAIEGLAKIGDKETLIILLRRHSELVPIPDFNIRLKAAEELAKIGDRVSLTRLLENPDETIRRRAVYVLVKLALPQDREIVLKHLQDQDFSLRLIAVEALASVALPQDREIVLKLIEDQDPAIRLSAIDALARVALPKDKEIILKLLLDEDRNVRRKSVYALAELIKQTENEDSDNLLDYLAENSKGYGENQRRFFEALSNMDQIFYSPIKRILE